MLNKDIVPEDANPVLKSSFNFVNGPSKFNESQRVKTIPRESVFIKDPNEQPLATLTESHVNLLKLFVNHMVIENFCNIPNRISQVKQRSNGSGPSQGFYCGKCSHIKFKARLKCGHSKCFNCLKSDIIELNCSPSCKNIKPIICKKCYSLPSPEEIRKLIGYNESISSIYPELTKNCGYCRRESNIYTEFFFELKCLHLCKNCYVDQVYMGIKKCMVCEKKFKNSSITKNRVDKCDDCKNEKSYFNDALKSYDNNNLLCYQCQNKSYMSRNIKPLITIIKGKESLVPFKKFINKKCPICHQDISLDEVRVCTSCENFICQNCLNSNPQCKLCSNDFMIPKK